MFLLSFYKYFNFQAIAYYEKAIKSGQTQLQFELVDLLLKLKQYPKAEKALKQVGHQVG